ncbi:MAG: hypothetical protein GY816_18955 [Cytophagales bacterium]|nr:hypothetical protein [Cytophagales bacterium]
MNSAVAIGHIDLDCGMGSMDEHSDDLSQEPAFRSQPCCDNEYVSVEVDDQFNPQFGLEISDFQLVSSSLLYELPALKSELSNSIIYYHNPPPTDVEVVILHQVFRI